MADYVSVIKDLEVKLKLTKVTVCKALVICHHFQRMTSEDTYDMKLVAAAAVSLIMRIENHRVEIAAFFEVLFGVTRPELVDDTCKKFEKNLLSLEVFLLKMLEGNISHKVAPEYLGAFLKSIRLLNGIDEIWCSVSAMSFQLACKMYYSNQCFQFMPEVLAAAAICLSLDMCGYSENSIELCKAMSPSVTVELMNQICDILLQDHFKKSVES